MERIKIITDSAGDVPKDIAKELDITVLHTRVVMNGETYVDDVDYDRVEYAKMMRGIEEIPKTSMVPLGEIKEEFMKNLDSYDHQIYVTLSSKASGTYNGAVLMKDEIEEETGKPSNITVYDSMAFSYLYGVPVMKAAEAVKNGASYDEVMEILGEISKMTAYFIVDDLNHLQKGGRINPAVAVVGNLLGIKPILTVKDGIVDSIGKERGKKKAIDKIVNMALEEINDPENQIVYIIKGDADEDAAVLEKTIREKIKCKDVKAYDLGSTIATHTGAGVVAIAFKK